MFFLKNLLLLLHQQSNFLLMLIIGLLAFVIYANTLKHGYVWDDDIVITYNQNVQKGLAGIPAIFSYQSNATQRVEDQYGYRPITLSAFALDIALFGKNPFYGHLMSVLYFALLCMLLYFTLQKLAWQYPKWIPFLATLLFVVHPIHVEVVANIKSRDEILALLFGCLAFLAAFRYVKNNSFLAYGAVLGTFMLAILAKEHLIIFAFLVPAALLIFYQASLSKILNLALPLSLMMSLRAMLISDIVSTGMAVALLCLNVLGLVLLYAWVNRQQLLASRKNSISLLDKKKAGSFVAALVIVMVLGGIMAHFLGNFTATTPSKIAVEKVGEQGEFIESFELNNSFFHVYTYPKRMALSFKVLGQYAKNFLLPYPLVYFYGYSQIPLTNFGDWQVILSLILHLLLVFYVLWGLTKTGLHRLGSYTALFYLVSILLCSQLVVYMPDTMADRFYFTPSIAACLAILLLLAGLFGVNTAINSISEKTKKQAPLKSNSLLTVVLIMAGVYALLTINRNKVWQSNEVLFAADMPHLKNCAKAHYYYGSSLYKKFKNASKEEQEQLKEPMLYHLQKSTEISDKSYYGYIHLIRAYLGLSKKEEAFAALQRVTALYPNELKSNQLMGMYYYYEKDFDQAIKYLLKAHQKAPKSTEHYFYLAWSYVNNGQTENALLLLEEGSELLPKYEGFYNVMSDIYLREQSYGKAIEALQKLLKINDNFQPAYLKIIDAYHALGEETNAAKYLKLARQKGY